MTGDRVLNESLLPLLNRPDHDSPDFKVVICINSNGKEVAIGRTELDVSFTAMRKVEILDGEFIVEESDNDITIPWLNNSVDNCDVTITDACFHHRIALNPTIECCFRVLDKVTIEVERIVSVVIGGRREARLDGFCKLKIKFLLELTIYDFYFGHSWTIEF